MSDYFRDVNFYIRLRGRNNSAFYTDAFTTGGKNCDHLLIRVFASAVYLRGRTVRVRESLVVG